MIAPRTDRAQRVPPPGGMLPPPDAHIAVWWATTDLPAATLEGLRSDLDAGTLARVNALVREEDRRRSIVAHGLLRRLIAACVGCSTAAVIVDRTCASCGAADHGKPTLRPPSPGSRPPLQFNLAHSGEVVVVALTGPGTDVGIDVETMQPGYDWTSARRHVFTDAEWHRTEAAADPTAERFALWARKEAAAKTTGHGLAIDLKHASIDPGAQHGAFWAGKLVAPERTYTLLVGDLPIRAGVAAAVATLTPGDPHAADSPTVRLVRADLSVD